MPRTKKRTVTVDLTDRERMLIVLYRSCPEPVRLEVGALLFERWTDGPHGDPQEKSARFKNACQALRTDKLTVSVFDELTGAR